MSNEKIKPQSLPSHGRGMVHRVPTPEELKQHEIDKPKILAGIRASHAKTMHKVRRMQGQPIYVDRG